MRETPGMPNPDRLTGLDASFLALEDRGAHMHVGSVLLFDGEAPAYEDFVAQLERRRLAGRIFAQRLDRAKPLWELWLVDRVGDDRFAIISKTHHALVDGISGVDLATVLFDLDADPPEQPEHEPWVPRPEPAAAALLADALAERAA